ncbi:MAG: T9SS type A sorting domain-containing protein [Candidatus Marinimicrobia bacterium]|nr:T9SS type A sorting domain-containing protein [Candidatus Neomarinimicrobiota bacterium]
MKTAKMLLLLSLISMFAYGQLFINEIDYNQPGTDATEYVELAGPAGTYLSVVVELINGNGDAIYQTADLGTITLTDESNGFGFYVIGAATVPNVDVTPGSWPTTNIIQNGDPDGVVLSVGGSIVDAVAYEGTMNDADGNAMEDGGTDFASPPDSSISRIGIDGSPWEHVTSTPGAVNTNQTFDPNVNYPPNANAGSDQSVDSGATVTLDGSGSTDSDGTIVSYLWEQVSGSDVTLTDANTSVASFVVPTVTETSSWVFSLTVTDDDGETGTDETTVTVYISAAMTILEARGQSTGTLVTVTGLVNSVNFSSSGTEYTFEDATAGIDLYFSGAVIDLGLGDEITVTGSIDEYNGKLEVVPATASDIVVNSTGNTLPDPQVITAAELATNGENYESELIMIMGVSNAGSGDAWPASGSNANIDITDNGTDVTVMRIDKETEIDGSTEPAWPMDVIGVVSEFSGTYQILPRMLSDFVSDIITPVFSDAIHSPDFVTSANEIEIYIDITPGDLVQTISSATIMYGTDGSMLNSSEMWLNGGVTWAGVIPAQADNTFLEYQVVAVTNDGGEFTSYTFEIAVASTETTPIADIQADPVEGQVFTVEGVITIGSGILQTGLTNAYMQDGSGHGINLFNYDEIELNRGDLVRAVGVIVIHYTTVELADFSYQLISTGNDIPTPVDLTPGEANAQIWEGTLVRVEGMISDTWSAGGGQTVLVTDGTDTSAVRIWESTGIDVSGLTVGTEWSFMGVGGQYYDEFQMGVGYAEDIVSTSDIVVLDSKPQQFALNPAYPNPFNPATTISWSLQESAELTIRVLDIRGREVTRLAEGMSAAGQFSMSWNASDLSSGVYFIQLTTPTESAIQKVMLVK